MTTSRTACKDAVATRATQAARASTEIDDPAAHGHGCGPFAAAQHDQRGRGRAIDQHARDDEDRQQVLERAGDREQPGKRRVNDDRDVRRAEGAVHGRDRARQVARFAEREDVARRDQHLHREPAGAVETTAAIAISVAPTGPMKLLRDVGERELRCRGVRQDAEAGQHQEEVQQAGDRRGRPGC